MVLVEEKKPGAARKQFEKTLVLSPHSAVALEELINLDIAENQFTVALDRINKDADEKGIARQLLLAKVHMARARSLAANGAKISEPDVKLNVPAAQDDVNQAEAALLKAIEIDPNRSTPYLVLAQLYVAAGKEQAALDRLNGLVSRTNNIAAYMQMGSIYDALKKYPAARDAYEKALATNPNFGPAINNLSYLYSEHLDDVDKGYALAEKARELSPQDPATADTLGWILYKKGEYMRALGLLTESASKLPEEPEVQLHLGMVQYMLGEEGAARLALQQAVHSTDEFPGKNEANRALAVLAVDAKTADAKARTDLEKRLQEQPNDPVAANRLAAIYERDGSLDKAAKTYELSLKQNPQNAQIMGRLAGIYLDLKNSEQAMDLAKQAHKLAPDDPVISCLLGRLVFQSGDYNWASSLLQQAAPKLPNQPDVQYDLAWSYYSMGRVYEAERTMQSAAPALTAARLDDAKQFLALVAAAKTPSPAAATQAGQILGANPNYVPALMVSALQAEHQGKQDDARSLYEKALVRYPSFTPAARNLAILYAQHPGDEQKAYDLGVKARVAYPNDTELARTLGMLAYRRGDYARASQLLQENSQQLTKDGEALYYLGMAHYQLKQKSQSKAELQRALGLNLESKLAEDARKTLAELK
jgi:tetratricopeptide (TPR) repeat protein